MIDVALTVGCLAKALVSVEADYLVPETMKATCVGAQERHRWLGPPTRDMLNQALVDHAYDIVHLFSHGDPRKPGLVLEDEHRAARLLEEADLTEILLRKRPSFVFLAACHSGQASIQAGSATDYQLGNLGYQLAKSGIPAVIAMRDRVLVDIALSLAAAYYPRLFRLGSVTLALAEARATIPGKKDQVSIPMLYSLIPGKKLYIPPTYSKKADKHRPFYIGLLLFLLLCSIGVGWWHWELARASARAEMVEVMSARNAGNRPFQALAQGMRRVSAAGNPKHPELSRQWSRALSRFPEVQTVALGAVPVSFGFGEGSNELWATFAKERLVAFPGQTPSQQRQTVAITCAVGNEAGSAYADQDRLYVSIRGKSLVLDQAEVIQLAIGKEGLLAADATGAVFGLDSRTLAPRLLGRTERDVVGLGFAEHGPAALVLDAEDQLALVELESGRTTALGGFGALAGCHVGRDGLAFLSRADRILYWLGTVPEAKPLRLCESRIRAWSSDLSAANLLACDDAGQLYFWRHGHLVARDELEERVEAVALSPDGTLFATAGGGRIDLWEAVTGKRLSCWPTGSVAINRLVFDRAGGRLLSATEAGTLLLWRLAPPLRIGLDVAYAPMRSCRSGTLLFSAIDGKTACFDLVKQRLLAEVSPEYLDTLLSPDGQLLFMRTSAASGLLWHLQDPPIWERIDLPASAAKTGSAVAFDAAGARLAFARARQVFLFDTRSSRCTKILELPRDLAALGFAAASKSWYLADVSGQIHRAAHGGEDLRSIGRPSISINWLFAPDRGGLVAVSRSGAVEWLDSSGVRVRHLALPGPLKRCEMQAEGKAILFHAASGALWLWEGRGDKDPWRLPDTWESFTWGRELLALTQSTRLAVLGLEDGRIFAEFEDPTAEYGLVDFGPAERSILAFDRRGLVKRWNLDEPAVMKGKASNLMVALHEEE